MTLFLGGPTPQDGESAYQIAVDNGFVGSQTQWLASLMGADGLSAYQVAQAEGFTGTVSQWLNSLIGAQGPQGPQGPPGVNGAAGSFVFPSAQPWTINGSGSSNISSPVGSYVKFGNIVMLSGKFTVTALYGVITLPYVCVNQITSMPIGFNGMNVATEGAFLTINASGFTGTIGFNLVGSSPPKTIGLTFFYFTP